MTEIQMQVPARPDYVHVLRSVAASVAAQMNFSYDEIEDLRLAVDEACAYLLAIPGTTSCLELALRQDEDSLEIVASVDATDPGAGRSDAQQAIIWHILGALTDEARLEEGQGSAIRIRKRRSL